MDTINVTLRFFDKSKLRTIYFLPENSDVRNYDKLRLKNEDENVNFEVCYYKCREMFENSNSQMVNDFPELLTFKKYAEYSREIGHKLANKGTKKKSIAILLCLFLGWLGAHRFYLGKKISGIVYLCTGGIFAYGILFDLVMLCKNELEDADGKYLS